MTHLLVPLVLMVGAVIVIVLDHRRGQARHAALDQALAGVPSRAPSPEVKRAIVVHDSPSMRASIAHVLEEDGYQVTETGDGGEALVRLAELSESCPTVVAGVDQEISGSSGLDLVKTVRSNPAFHAGRIVMMTPASEVERA